MVLTNDKLRILGEIFACKLSTDIVFLLTQQEYYTNEITNKLNLRTSLVIHHLNKLKKLGIIITTHHKINPRKHHVLREYYRIDPEKLLELFNDEFTNGMKLYGTMPLNTI